MHDLKKFFIILRHINAQKLDSRNRIRGYAYFADSALFATKYVYEFFPNFTSKLIVPIFFGQVEIFSGK